MPNMCVIPQNKMKDENNQVTFLYQMSGILCAKINKAMGMENPENRMSDMDDDDTTTSSDKSGFDE